MPLPMVHLAISKNILDAGFKAEELPQYYLGSISPDAIHMRQGSDRAAKNQTHLIPVGKKWEDVNEPDYCRFLLDYIKANKNKTNADFLWGYGIHILTDMYWTRSVYKDFVGKYENDPAPLQDIRWAYYNDTDILDQVLFNESGWREEVWKSLQTAKGADFFDLLSANEIDLWNERTLHWYDSGESQHKNPVRYFAKSDILSFITECSEKLYNVIRPSPERRNKI